MARTGNHVTAYFLSAAFSAWTIACGGLPDGSGAEAADGPGVGTAQAEPHDDGEQQAPQNPEEAVTPTQEEGEPPPPPQLDPLPSRYGYDDLPLRGISQPEMAVCVEGGRGGKCAKTDVDGAFCVDVPLRRNTRQTLAVYAHDASGSDSEAVLVEIEHDPSLQETVTPSPTLVNVATPRSVLADPERPKEGMLVDVVDDDRSTSILVHRSSLWVELDEPHDIGRIEIEFPDSLGAGNDEFATEYAIFASQAEDPSLPPQFSTWGDAYQAAEGWELLYHVGRDGSAPGGDGGLDVFLPGEPVRARLVGFRLIENNKIDWFSSENIRIAEIRVFALVREDPVPRAPTCENGGRP